MTIEQTRQLGIEFERRIQTLFPQTKTIAKMDTEDIYSFLNQYQKQYIRQLYMSEDQMPSDSRQSVLIQDILRTLTKHKRLTSGIRDYSVDIKNKTFVLPNDYYQYIRSSSEVFGTYKNLTKNTSVANVLLKQSDMSSVIESYFDGGRILRNPVVSLEWSRIKVVYDQYTTLDALDLTYLRAPSEFSILTNTPCELPFECFEELVSGALDLYIRHLQATQPRKERRKKEEDE
jgi:hypothetical protein